MQIERSFRAPLRCNVATEGREQRQMREEALGLVWETDEWLNDASDRCGLVEQVRYQGQRVMEAQWLQLSENQEVLARRHFCDDGEVLSIWHIEPVSQGRQVQVMLNRREGTLTFLEGFQPN